MHTHLATPHHCIPYITPHVKPYRTSPRRHAHIDSKEHDYRHTHRHVMHIDNKKLSTQAHTHIQAHTHLYSNNTKHQHLLQPTCTFACCVQARLAQSAERKALNLVVVGSSPTVGVSLMRSGEHTSPRLTLMRLCRCQSQRSHIAASVSAPREHILPPSALQASGLVV